MTTPRTNRPTLFTQSHLKLSVQNDLIQARTPRTPPGLAMFQQCPDNPSVGKEFDIQYSVAVSAESAKKARGLCSLEENNAEHSKY